ncbi:MAG: VCBS repeat-containing protein [Nitrospiraceae bacterium]|nr:MAG: VCBS repeat-containing protein [Nitrospiraceae bacterium]
MDRAAAGPVQESAPIVIEPESVDRAGNVNALDRVLAYFARVNGEVEKVYNGTVWIRLEGQVNLINDMRFSVFREAGVFYHPVTNDPIGSSEAYIGRIELRDDTPVDGLFPCTVLSGDIAEGDKIRITSSRIKLAFFQDRSSDWASSEHFYDILQKSGRFEIMEAYTSSYEPEVLTGLAKKLGAQVVLMFSTSSVKGPETVNINLYWTEDAKLFSEIEEPLDPENAETIPQRTKSILHSSGKTGLQKIYELDGGNLFTVGDAVGDGKDYVVIGDDNKVFIYSVNDELYEKWSVKGPRSGSIVSIDMLDVNLNGRPEIFVTNLVNNSQMRSFVIEYDRNRGFQNIVQDIPFFFRVTGNTLLMQKFGRVRTFSGSVYEGEWRNGKYRKRSKLNLADDVNIYGFATVDWYGTNENQLVSINDEGILRLYDNKGKVERKVNRSFGKPEISFRNMIGNVMEYEEWFVRGRLMKIAAGKGEALVVINRIPATSFIPGLGSKGGEVYMLWQENGVILEKLIQKEIPGSISDYLIKGDNLFLISKGSTLSNIKNFASDKSRKNSLLFHFKLSPDKMEPVSSDQNN